MFELLKTTLTQIIDPYAEEARSLVADRTTEGRTYLDRIVTSLDRVTDAVLSDKWEEVPKKPEFTFAEADGTYELGTVPRGTMWVMEVFQAMMLAGTATVVIEANGKFRGATSVTTTGLGTAGISMTRGLHLTGGDIVTVRTIGMAAGETMVGYVQFRARPIKAPAKHTGGQPQIMADRKNDQGDDLERHSTPGIFLAPNVRGGSAARDPHMPPALPRLR